MYSSIFWVYSSVLYFQSILWHSVSKPWEYSIIIVKLLSEHILEYSKNTQDVLWAYSSVLYFPSILWHSVSKNWVYSIISNLLLEYILEYLQNTQDVL